MRKVLLATLCLGLTVTANGQTTFQSRRGELSGVEGFWWRGDIRSDETTLYMRNYVLGFEGLELRSEMATAAKPTAQADSVVYTLTGTVTLRLPIPAATPTPAQ